MAQRLGIDWYAVHKLNFQNFDLLKFNHMVSNCQIGYGVDNVSKQYRKKILILFQMASKIIKKQVPEVVAQCSQLAIKKGIYMQNIVRRQHQLQTSFQQIANLRMIWAQKKRILQRLKQKISKRQKKKQKKIYYCSFCEREDFENVQLLKAHISSAHSNKNIENRSETSNQVNQIKDLLMTMKDKEIEMMSMFIRASRQMQTQKLEKDYQQQYKRYMHVSGTKTEQSKEQQLQELKGQSKFLFFQKSEPFRRQMQQNQQFRNNLKKQRQQHREKSINEVKGQVQAPQQKNYYNIFKNIQQNVSAHIEEVKPTQEIKSISKRNIEPNEARSFTYYDPNSFLTKFLKNQSISKDSRFSLVENTHPKPYVQLKEEKLVQQEIFYPAPSISDRLRQANKKKDSKLETMFSTKRKFYQDSGYVFNSGPLVDDKGGDSDYEDYFGANGKNNEIEDEQIRMHPISSNKSYNMASKQSFHLSKLLSPKESNSFIKSDKQKSSVIVDLSDSFSRRDFQISKDDDSINLSDLKFSKLQKKKEEERLKKLKETEEKKSIVSDSNVQNKSHSKQVPSGSDYSKVSKESIKAQTKVAKGIDVLKSFQRKKVTPILQQNFSFEEQGIINNYMKKNERITVLGTGEDIIKGKFAQQNSLGVLGEFLKKQTRSPERKERVQKQQLANFIRK